MINTLNFDYLSLISFVQAAKTKSFTEAAKYVGRTQPAVSQQISKLEKQLGKTLFHREKKLALTPDGELFLSYAKRICSLYNEAYDVFKKPELEGELRFGLPEDFCSVFLSEVLQDFIKIHPRVLLHVECDLTLNLYNRFKDNDLDLVLVKMCKPKDYPMSHDVWSENLIWVGDKAFIRKNTPIPLVLSPQPCVYRSRAINALDTNHQPWRIAFSSHSFASMLAAVKAGMGLTVLPRNMVPKGLDHLKIVSHNLPKLEDTHVSLLMHEKENDLTNTFQAFVLEKINS